MTLRPALLLIALAVATPAAHAATAWRVQPDDSSLGFTGTAQGESFSGRFDDWQATIVFSPDDLAGSRFEVTIDTASADTDNAERDEALVGSDFFAVKRHPQATYVATSFESLGEGRYAAAGELTLRGRTHPVTFEFDWKPGDGGATLEGSATLDRTQFGVGGGDWEDASMIAHEVEVVAKLSLTSP